MDRLESLGTALSQITMYDIKSMYNQAKNVVLNVSEMEAKVRDATNDEPWGASSTLMQEIAQGTFNFQNFNEIMPCIYTRFMEKEAKQWRQIYKALQLLEYLVKNGSERVVDDARSHIATIKMLRNFYYIDEKGKDQGLNVRNRSKELVELLGDVEKIRAERRKAKVNKSKYIGTGNDGMSLSSGGGRYGGFGSDASAYGGSSSSYGGGGGGNYGGDYSGRDYSGGSGGFRDSSSRRNYEEYDAGDDDVAATRRSNSISVRGSTSSPAPRRSATTPATPTTATKAKAPEPVPDLLGLDDDFSAPIVAPAAATSAPAAAAAHVDIDDDFADFQAAPLSPAASTSTNTNISFAAAPLAATIPKSVSPPLVPQQANASLFNMLAPTTTSPPPMASARPPAYSSTSFTSTALQPTSAVRTGSGTNLRPTPAATTPAATLAAKPSSNFDDLWSMSLGGSSSTANKPQATTAKSIQALQQEKAQAGIWGTGQQAKPPGMGTGFGSFGGAPASSTPAASSGNGLDDLLF